MGGRSGDRSAPRRYRVAVADDDAGVLVALGDLLGSDPRFDLCGSFLDGEALRAFCAVARPDVALADVAMPGGGPGLAREVRTASPGTVVVAYTAHGDRRTRTELLAAGVAAVLEKGRTGDIAGALVALLGAAPPAGPS